MTLARTAVVGLLAISSSAYAQSPAAESLFRDGRALIKQGKLQEGCDKLEASELVEPSVGTLLNIGDCRERLGKLATAWAAFRKAEAMAKQSGASETKREAEARKRAQRLEPQLPTLTVAVARPLPGLVIKKNGEKIDTPVLGTDVPVDPGNYRITAEAPGYKPWQLDVSLQIRGKRQITVPSLDRLAPPAVAAGSEKSEKIDLAPPMRAEAPMQVVYRPLPVRHQESSWTAAREASVAVGVVGAIAFGAGAYYGLHSSDLESRANKVCPGTMCGDPVGLRLNDDAQNSANRANVMFVVGGAAVATATTLWIIGAPDSHHEIRPAIGPDGVGATFAGRF